MTRRSARLRPWIALLLPALAWMLFEWGLAAALGPACGAAGSWLGIGWAALSLVACTAAVLLARPVARSPEPADTRPWIATLAQIGAGIFALAILLQTLAVLIVPSCVA